MLPELVAIVERGQHDQSPADLEARPEHDLKQVGGHLGRRFIGQMHQPPPFAPQAPAGDQRDEQHLQDAEAQVNGVGPGNNPLPVRERIDPVPVEGQLLRQIQKAELPHLRHQAREHQKAEDRNEGDGQTPGDASQLEAGFTRRGLQPRAAAKVLAGQFAQELGHRVAEVPQHHKAAHQKGRGGQVLAFDDLPFLAGLLPAIRRRFMRLVAKVVGCHEVHRK
jgi:hypothetical protein